jgi:hypothetical protein
MTDFIETPQASEPNYLETLVGEDKKFKNAEELAKGKALADQAIAIRERENQELREQLQALRDKEELLRLASETEKARQAQERQPNPDVAREPAISKDDLARQMRELLSETKEQDKFAANMESVAEKLVAHLGDAQKANEFVANKARELGVSVKFLREAAAQSPAAFFQTVGLTQPQTPASPNPSQSDVNVGQMERNASKVQPGTYAYYRQLQIENPALSTDRNFQQRMHADAQAKGDAFFN